MDVMEHLSLIFLQLLSKANSIASMASSREGGESSGSEGLATALQVSDVTHVTVMSCVMTYKQPFVRCDLIALSKFLS